MSVSAATFNLALCSEFKAKKCDRCCMCFPFMKNKKISVNRDSDTDSEDLNEESLGEKIREDSSNISILNAPKVHVHLNSAQAKESDFYLFDTHLKYFVVQGPHIHKKYMRLSKVIGKSVKECNLPENIADLLHDLYVDTLKGHYDQVQLFMDGNCFLINTYPIKDEKHHIVGGMFTCRPSTPDIHNVRTFRLDELEKLSKKISK